MSADLPGAEADPRPAILPVILSGGSGTRLWPLSTDRKPKQFHALASQASMFQETALRVRSGEDLGFLPPLVICNRAHRDLVEAQLADVGVKPSAVVLEPFGRSTAPAAVIAAQFAAEHPGALVLLLPADHRIADTEAFRTAVRRAAPAADRFIVTFGIAPTAPETGYGYIQAGEPVCEGVLRVARFAEKPDRATAQAYLDDGGYAWNAGMFLFRPQRLLEEVRRLRPDVLAGALAALAGASRRGACIELPDDLFAACPSVSLDYAVMERTDCAAVAPCDFGWADVGSWGEVWRLGDKDAGGNVARGRTQMADTTGSLVWSEGGQVVATLGVRDLVVIATDRSVLVLDRARAQDVREVVDHLIRTGRGPGPG